MLIASLILAILMFTWLSSASADKPVTNDIVPFSNDWQCDPSWCCYVEPKEVARVYDGRCWFLYCRNYFYNGCGQL